MKKGFLFRWVLTRVAPFLARHPGILLVLAVLYILSPLDLLPEGLFGLAGYIEDILIFVGSLFLIQKLKTPFTSTKGTPEKMTSQNPYKILEIPMGASKEEITKAYRKKMAEYHPDKVAHLGEDLKKLAHEKALQIQRAYETLNSKT